MVRLNASTVLMSGNGAPFFTTTPSPDFATCATVSAETLPCAASASIAAEGSTTKSISSPPRTTRAVTAPAVSLVIASVLPVLAANGCEMSSKTGLKARVVSTLISTAQAWKGVAAVSARTTRRERQRGTTQRRFGRRDRRIRAEHKPFATTSRPVRAARARQAGRPARRDEMSIRTRPLEGVPAGSLVRILRE